MKPKGSTLVVIWKTNHAGIQFVFEMYAVKVQYRCHVGAWGSGYIAPLIFHLSGRLGWHWDPQPIRMPGQDINLLLLLEIRLWLLWHPVYGLVIPTMLTQLCSLCWKPQIWCLLQKWNLLDFVYVWWLIVTHRPQGLNLGAICVFLWIDFLPLNWNSELHLVGRMLCYCVCWLDATKIKPQSLAGGISLPRFPLEFFPLKQHLKA